MTMRAMMGSIGASLAIAFALPAAPARTAEPKAAPAAPPHAEEVLRAMSAYLGKAKAYSYHAEIEFDQILPRGPKIRLAGAVDVAMARPESLHVDYRDDISDRVGWFENGRLKPLGP